MKSLEPWKIWAATAVLVCAILGSTAARVRPQVLGVTSAQAATLTPTEQTPAVATPHPESSADEYEAYSSYSPGRTCFGSGYSAVQISTIVRLSSLLYGAGDPSAIQTDEYLEPVADVTRQIFGNQNSQTDLVATNSEQPNAYNYLPIPDIADNQFQNDMFTDVPDDHWAYAAVSDTDPTFSSMITPPDPNDLYLADFSGANEANIIGLAIQNTLVTAAFNNLYVTGDVEPPPFPPTGYVIDPQTFEIYNEAVNPAAYQNLAMSGALNMELGDEIGLEQQVPDTARWQALRVEAQAEALAQIEAAQEQRLQVIYSANTGRINVPISGVQFTVPPQD